MMKLSKTLLSGVIFSLLLLTMMSYENQAENLPSAKNITLESAEKKLNNNLKMYKIVWDDIINKREIDKINATNFDTSITLITSPENIVGIEGFKAYYQHYLTGFSDITFTLVDVFGQGNKIVKHWNFKGTHTGEFFGIAASGKQVDIDGVTLVKMKDGKIAQEQDFLDNLLFYRQLGLIPAD
ncbi:ester cyclase [Colwellia sp. C1TZA3]|uniref:ester cyclase n=1 Tax=Colwellia sp. C1TZA3 TaxID=2508879 RepID=UPI0011B98F5D|nr:ester cyclase [Colwellia sp. C1TZA3]TWX72676.1 ester cyclase [Colwellia sp. C1TZA3]